LPNSLLRAEPEVSANSSRSGAYETPLEVAASAENRKAVGEAGIHDNVFNNLNDIQREKEEEERRLIQHYKDRFAKGGARSSSMSGINIGELPSKRQLVHRFISNWIFDITIGVVICANAFTIGLETSYTVKNLSVPVIVEIAGGVFLAVYTIELSLRFYAYHSFALKSNWVRFDTFLVIAGLGDILLKVIMNGQSNDVLDKVMLTRMLRLARLARAARLLIQFKVLWELVRGLMGSMYTVLWTGFLIVLLIYIFAILGMELIGVDPDAGEDYQQVADEYFRSGLGTAMLTLVQFVIMDSIGPIFRPLVLAKPALMFYFSMFLLIVSVALMNLVTAIIVDSAVQQSHADREATKAYEGARRKALLPGLKQLFLALDGDGSGDLTLEELLEAPKELKDQLEEVARMEDCQALFKMLDYDNSGSIEIDEFCDGILKSQAEKPIELLCLLRQCGDILQTSRSSIERFDRVEERLTYIETDMRRLTNMEADVHSILLALRVAPQMQSAGAVAHTSVE